ncbi:MAG: hypothetical protein RL095_3993, partial [Verrucomicrobiota bacterium]
LKDPVDTPIPKLKASLKEERQPDGSLHLIYTKDPCTLDYRKIGKLVDHPSLPLAPNAPFIVHGLLTQDDNGSLEYQAISPSLSPDAIEEIKSHDHMKSSSRPPYASLVLSLQNSLVTRISFFDPCGHQWAEWHSLRGGIQIKNYAKGLYAVEVPKYAVELGRPLDILLNVHLDPETLHPADSKLGTLHSFPDISSTMLHELGKGKRIPTKPAPGATLEVFSFHEALGCVTGEEMTMNGWSQGYAHWAEYAWGLRQEVRPGKRLVRKSDKNIGGFVPLNDLQIYRRNERHWIHLPRSSKFPVRDEHDLLEWRIQSPLRFTGKFEFHQWIMKFLSSFPMTFDGVEIPHEFPAGTSIRDMLKHYFGHSLGLGQRIHMDGRELKVTRFGLRSSLP